MDAATVIAEVMQSMRPTGVMTGLDGVPAGGLAASSSSAIQPTQPLAPEETTALPLPVVHVESVPSTQQADHQPSPPVKSLMPPFKQSLCFGLSRTLVESIDAVLTMQKVESSSSASSEPGVLAELLGRGASGSKTSASRPHSGADPLNTLNVLRATASYRRDAQSSAGTDTLSVEAAQE